MKDKMKNIHILTTDKPSRLYLGNNGNFVFGMIQTSIQSRNDDFTNQNIYITSDEEIKEGDWFYVKTPNIYGGNVVARCLSFGKHCWSKNILTATTDEKGYHPSHCVKIILTTDTDLIKDAVQAIDEEFLEWICKNPSCEEVDIKKLKSGKYWLHKAIIPKEEPKKVLTEEDIFNQKDIDAVTDYINKEQQKQHLIDMMESDEELGLYEQIDQNNPITKGSTALVKKIKFEDVFNDEKREGVKRVIHQHKVLKELSLVNPLHLQMTSNGHGEFPDGYKLTEKGIQYIIEQLNKE